MTSLERVMAALQHREPDRVPFFLLLTTHGARELGLSIREYFAQPTRVAEGQIRMRAKYRHDCLYAIFYAAVEVEAWGGEVVFLEDGPPNAGAPIIRRPEEILRLTPPDIHRSPPLQKALKAIQLMKDLSHGDVPVIGAVMAPFSLPVMQMGFEAYLLLMHERPELFEHLMRVNEAFCVAWANAQFEAGATALGYFDPVSSPTIVPPQGLGATGLEIARRTLARIRGPVAIHMASGRTLPIVRDLLRTGSPLVGVSVDDDLAALKAACRGQLAILGNLDGIAMRLWSPAEAEVQVKTAIARAGAGGGYILADHHGEIPWQVPEETLVAISESVHRWGRYPLDWVNGDGG